MLNTSEADPPFEKPGRKMKNTYCPGGKKAVASTNTTETVCQRNWAVWFGFKAPGLESHSEYKIKKSLREVSSGRR